MNRFLAVSAVALLLCGAGRAAAQCDDPYDATLCAPTLTANQIAQFSHTDQAVSAFWSDWAGKDYAELVAPDDCYPDRCGFVGTDDAAMTIKAAASASGLYLYLEVMDNTWVDRSDASDIGADATDMFLDKMSADEIFTCTGCLIGLYNSLLSYTTNQFQIWFGTSAPTGINFQAYDENLWSWQALGLTFQQAEILKGMKVEVIALDATHKAQEWFFPWKFLGSEGILEGTDISSRRIAFTGGYNDKDGDNTTNHCLRWTTKDPWVGAGETNYWGDILLAADVGQVVYEETRVEQPLSAAGASRAAVGPASYYTLKGEAVSGRGLSSVSNGTVLLKKVTGGAVSKVNVVR